MTRVAAPAAAAPARDHVDGLREWIETAAGWKRCSIAFGAGLVSVLAFAPFFLGPVLFATLPVLVWLIDSSAETPLGRRRGAVAAAFADGWWWGFGFFIGGLFWVGEALLVEAEKFAWALPLAVVAMPAGLALFHGAAAAATRSIWRPGFARLLILAAAIGVSEWLRGHILTGFPWNVLGYALTYPLVLMQSAAWLGIYGLTVWAVLIFSAPLVLSADAPAGPRRRRMFAIAAGSATGAVMLLALIGTVRLAGSQERTVEGVKIRIVQPSVPQREKWLAEKQREIFDLHLALSRTNAAGAEDGLAGVTHLVWPEAAMPFRPLEQPAALEAIGALLGSDAFLLSGGLRVVRPDEAGVAAGSSARVYNSLLAFGPGGGLAALYDKIHLVPFGEFLPFQAWLETIGIRQLTNLPGGFATGLTPRPLLHLGRLPPAAGLICYEAIFPGDVVQGAERPGVLVNVTNDGWFGDTTGPRQHFHQARVRAVEEGLPLIRAANNGISALVDPYGRVRHSLGMNVRGVIDGELPVALPPTLYARFGEIPFWLSIVGALVVALGRSAGGAWRRT